jgi:hypothetical protein
MMLEVLCGASSGCLLPPSPYIFGERGVLSYGCFGVEDAVNASLAGDLVELHYPACLHRFEGGFCLLFPDLPELI